MTRLVEGTRYPGEESIYRTIFEKNMNAILLISPEGRLIHLNHACAVMYGYTDPDEMLKKVSNADQLYADPEASKDILRIIEEKGEMMPDEFEAIRNDGSRFFVLTASSVIRDTEGNVLCYQTEHIDVTDRKLTYEALKNASAYNRSLIEASLDPLVTIGPDGKITDVNRATQDIVGFKKHELIGKDFSDYFTDPERAQSGYREVFSKGFVRNYSLDLKRKDGRIISVLYNATLYRDSAGKVKGVFAAARDITELKKAEDMIRQTTNKLRKLTQHIEEVRESERKQVARDLHDDLGQKLTALNMDIAWLRSRIGVQSKNVGTKLNEMTDALNGAIESIKKISYGLRPSILDDLGLAAAIRWQLSEFTRLTGITYYVTFIPDDIKIDERISLIVYRIVQETLTNIIRHSKASLVKMRMYSGKRLLELLIVDNGIGIEEDRINDPESFGLLGIMERTKSCGGNLMITGKKGMGTKIVVTIPLDPGAGKIPKHF